MGVLLSGTQNDQADPFANPPPVEERLSNIDEIIQMNLHNQDRYQRDNSMDRLLDAGNIEEDLNGGDGGNHKKKRKSTDQGKMNYSANMSRSFNKR